jgi:nucleoside-diphosphate-sugar epimerase
MGTTLGFEWTIVRFPTLYGPGFRPGGMCDTLALQLPKQRVAVRIAWPGRMALLDVRDAAKLLINTASHCDTPGRTYMLSSGENPTMAEITLRVAECIGVPFSPLRLPACAVKVLRVAIGARWQWEFLPHSVQIAAWRGSLLLNGLYCDGSELTRLLNYSYHDWKEGFARMYAEDPLGRGMRR